MQETIIIEPRASQKAEYAVIWLHGLGADGNDFVPLAGELQRLIDKPLRFVFPHAPLRPVTLNNGYVMRAWYDITGLSLDAREDRDGLDGMIKQVDVLIQHQLMTGISYEKVFLGGFSQGAGAILYAGLRYPQQLAGLVALSGYLPLGRTLLEEKHSANQHIPIFWGHGSKDTIVPLKWAEISSQQLKFCGFDHLSSHVYPMAHELCGQEIEDLAHWFKQNGK